MLSVTPIACLEDNYAYLVEHQAEGATAREAVVIDPSEPGPVLAAIRAAGAHLVAILCTHHHYDHVGGNVELAREFPGLRIYASAHDRGRLPGQTDDVVDGLVWPLAGMSVRALHVPGHTLGAMTYVIEDAAFTGDTLFLGGCGRLFEGTAAMMYQSLNGKLAALPPDTRVFCGHEYTQGNLRFAASLEPKQATIAARLERVQGMRKAGQPTVGAALREEFVTNPFLRCDDPALRTALGMTSDTAPEEVFATIRRAKDRFS